jgi:hypothetical protein
MHPFHIAVATAGMGIPPKADLRLFQNRYKSIICEEDPLAVVPSWLGEVL